MLLPSACFSCGEALGDVGVVYEKIRRARMAARYGAGGAVAPTRAGLDPAAAENVMKDVLDALRVTGCCRTHLATYLSFKDVYY